jgi:putative membrane protein
MKRLLSQIIAAALGLWFATLFVQGVAVKAYADSSFFGVPLTAQWQIFLVLGIVLGLLNYFIKPILKTIALPLEIITLGLFTLVINAGLIWFLDLIFDELYVPWMWPLIYATLIIWSLNLIISKLILKDKD